MRKTLLVFLNLIAYTAASGDNNTTDAAANDTAYVCGDDCQDYTVDNGYLQGNLTALAALEDALSTCKAANPPAEDTTTTDTDAAEASNDTEASNTTATNNTTDGGSQARILRFKTQLNAAAEDPCKAEQDAYDTDSPALEAYINNFENTGLPSDDHSKIDEMLKAKKRLFLLSTVQPNAEAEYYGEFMEMLAEQQGHWNHSHDVDEEDAVQWGIKGETAEEKNKTDEAEVDECHKVAAENRTKADGVASAAIQAFVTYINETIVVPSGNVSENETFTIDHTGDYQLAYKTYLLEVQKATVAIINAMVSIEEDEAVKKSLAAYGAFMEVEKEEAQANLEEHIAAQAAEGGSALVWILVVGAVVIGGGFAVWWFFCREKKKDD